MDKSRKRLLDEGPSVAQEFDGSRLPSGVYIYRLESGGFNIAKKFILLK